MGDTWGLIKMQGEHSLASSAHYVERLLS